MIVSQGLKEDGSLEVPTQGFLVYSTDSIGKCFKDDPKTLKYYPNLPLTFDNDITVSCTVSFASIADFKTYCETSPTKDYKIFSQFLNDFDYLSIFGNPSVSNLKDWVTVIKSADFET